MKFFILRIFKFFIPKGSKFIQIKDIFFSEPAEYLFRAVSFIKSNKLIDDDSVILDIGSADGGTCRYFSNQFPKNQIIGFEPIPESYHKAKKNCVNFKNITLNNFAIGKNEGTLNFYITNNKLSSSLFQPKEKSDVFSVEKVIETSVFSLDSITREFKSIGLIKIDVQGAELNTLSGGLETLKKTKMILIEMNNNELYENGVQYFEMDEFLRNNGFKLLDIIVTYRPKGIMKEFDAIYIKK